MQAITPENNEKYRLFALQAGDRPSDTEFYFLLPDIDLVYTTVEPPGAVEVRNPEQLPAAARAWLLETIDDITARYLRDNEEALLTGTKTFTERFRMELEREKRRTQGKNPVRVKVRGKSDGQTRE